MSKRSRKHHIAGTPVGVAVELEDGQTIDVPDNFRYRFGKMFGGNGEQVILVDSPFHIAVAHELRRAGLLVGVKPEMQLLFVKP